MKTVRLFRKTVTAQIYCKRLKNEHSGRIALSAFPHPPYFDFALVADKLPLGRVGGGMRFMRVLAVYGLFYGAVLLSNYENLTFS
jgi:hypothetical protein